VSSSEALDVFHWAMYPTLYRGIAVAIKMVKDSPEFFVIVDFVVTHNHN
jgi:hypothetical protein